MKRAIGFFFGTVLLACASFGAVQIQQQRSIPNSPQSNAARASIQGTVTRTDTGQPLKGATVTLQRATSRGQAPQLQALATAELRTLITNLSGVVATVTTDENGRFVLNGVDPGQYQISAMRDGFIRSEYGQRTLTGPGVAVTVAADQRLTLDLKMARGSVMSGRVITADGEPAANATVRAYTYEYADGRRSLAEVKSEQTNDLGEYRLFYLNPGDYFVSVTTDSGVDDGNPVGVVDVSQGQRGRGNVGGIQLITRALGDIGGPIGQALGGEAPPVYYPGTLDPEGAIQITVPASAEVRGVDFNLRYERTATLSGRVIAPFPLNTSVANAGGPGRGNTRGVVVNGGQVALPIAPVQLSLNRVGEARAGIGGLLNLRLASTPVNADGTFEIRGVAPGQYNLIATAQDPNGQQYTARTRVDVASGDIPNINLAVRPGAEVRGRILLESSPPQQFNMTNLRVGLVAEDSGIGGVMNFTIALGGRGGGRGALGVANTTAPVEADGSFTIRDVGAMEYRVQVLGLPQGAYLQAGRLESTDALSGPFTVDNPQALLQLQIGFSPGRVAGTVLDERANPAPGARAVLVPDEARRGRSDAYFTATTDQMGQFVFNAVPPGTYKIFAWEDVPEGAYQYPDFIRRYEDRGQTVTVNANGIVNADARLIPAR